MRTSGIAAVVAVLAAAGPAAASAAWGPAFDLSPPGRGSTGRSSAVVAAPGSRFVAAWTAGSRVQARRVGPQATGSLLTLASAGAGVDDVRLWPSPDGSTVATWAQPVSRAKVAIRMRTIGADDRLGPTVTITQPGDDAHGVVAVPRRGGSTTVAWIARTGAQAAVVNARQVSPAGVPGPVTTLTAPDGQADELVGAADIDDGAMLVWNAGGTLFGRRITAAGAPARPAFQISGQGETASAAQLATDGTGGATAVWVQGRAPTSVQEVAIISDDKLSGLDQLSAPGVPSLLPSLAFRGLAGVVVWEARPATGAVVVGVDADGRRSTLSRPSPGSAELRPDAAIDAAGHGFAVWRRGAAVQVARFGPGLTPRVATVSNAASRDAFPHVAAAAGGRALAIWARTTRAGTRVQGAAYTLRLAKRGNGR